jgi:hypothetical protein
VLQKLIDLLAPVAEDGNLFAVTWKMRLSIAQAPLFDDEYRERAIAEFKTSIQSMFEAVLVFRDALISIGFNFGGNGGNTPTQGS